MCDGLGTWVPDVVPSHVKFLDSLPLYSRCKPRGLYTGGVISHVATQRVKNPQRLFSHYRPSRQGSSTKHSANEGKNQNQGLGWDRLRAHCVRLKDAKISPVSVIRLVSAASSVLARVIQTGEIAEIDGGGTIKSRYRARGRRLEACMDGSWMAHGWLMDSSVDRCAELRCW